MANSANAGREPRLAAAPVSAAGFGGASRKRPRDVTADLLGKCEGRFLAADVPTLAQLVRLCGGAPFAAAEARRLDSFHSRAASQCCQCPWCMPASCIVVVNRLAAHWMISAVACCLAARSGLISGALRFARRWASLQCRWQRPSAARQRRSCWSSSAGWTPRRVRAAARSRRRRRKQPPSSRGTAGKTLPTRRHQRRRASLQGPAGRGTSTFGGTGEHLSRLNCRLLWLRCRPDSVRGTYPARDFNSFCLTAMHEGLQMKDIAGCPRQPLPKIAPGNNSSKNTISLPSPRPCASSL